MEHPTILKQVSDTPATEERHKRSRFTLPPQQLAKARSRLSFLALIFACMCVVASATDRLFSGFYAHSLLPVYVFNGITSTILYTLTRIKRIGDRWVLSLGLVYEVLMCLSVSMGFTWVQYQVAGTPPPITWVCVVLVAYPLIIPTRPMRTFATATIAAAMVPLGLFILSFQGWVTPRAFDYVDISISPLLCVALAVMGSRVIYGLNIEIARAQQMGSYQLVDLIGRGGMGEVWRAKHRLLARPAAVKLVNAEILASRAPADHQRILERFKREAQVTADLNSPHTVNLYDFGITDDGIFYYVMELLDGIDLDTLVSEYGPLPPERTVQILLQACHSLREAHDQGLVHRDIKPANLILCRHRACDYDMIKVLDFGLVVFRPDTRPDDPHLTVEGQIGGTPAYMPPETLTETQVDGRADIYALGCVAYWLLTGQLVFEAVTPLKIALAHVQNEPTPPSKRTEIEIPPELERLVMECLEKDPGHRPQTATELADRLRGIDVATSWTQERARDWWELHQPI